MCKKVKEKRPEMGLSSNQARFLSLTSRQVDLEQRIQQICQRRLRLTSELENIATSYNKSISNRKMFTPFNAGIQKLTLQGLNKLGYKVIDAESKQVMHNIGVMNKPTAPSSLATSISSAEDFMDLVNVLNNGTPAEKAAALAGNYVLTSDIDLSGYSSFDRTVMNGTFAGTFDGQGHTISGANITTDGTGQYIGFFAKNSGTIKNLALDNFSITDNNNDWTGVPNYSYIGTLTGQNSGIIDNISITDSNINLSGSNYGLIGGLTGQNTGQISSSYSTTDIVSQEGAHYVGGLVGDSGNTSIITSCYSTGDITVGDNSLMIAGFRGGYDDMIPAGSGSTIKDCFSTGNVIVGANTDRVGGFISESRSPVSSVVSSYTTGNVIAGSGSINVGGFVGAHLGGSVDASNYYQNNMTTDAPGSFATTNPIAATAGWDKTTVWDFSGDSPALRGTNTNSSSILEEGLRSGKYSLVREADEFTQNPITLDDEQYEEIDWRATPQIFDELYKGDDVEAENKYDKTVEEINSQDKKLQLEQTSVEVEYKAISSERESVKKILDTNAQSSFKYFS